MTRRAAVVALAILSPGSFRPSNFPGFRTLPPGDTIPTGYGTPRRRDDVAVRITTDRVDIQVLPLSAQSSGCSLPTPIARSAP